MRACCRRCSGSWGVDVGRSPVAAAAPRVRRRRRRRRGPESGAAAVARARGPVGRRRTPVVAGAAGRRRAPEGGAVAAAAVPVRPRRAPGRRPVAAAAPRVPSAAGAARPGRAAARLLLGRLAVRPARAAAAAAAKTATPALAAAAAAALVAEELLGRGLAADLVRRARLLDVRDEPDLDAALGPAVQDAQDRVEHVRRERHALGRDGRGDDVDARRLHGLGRRGRRGLARDGLRVVLVVERERLDELDAVERLVVVVVVVDGLRARRLVDLERVGRREACFDEAPRLEFEDVQQLLELRGRRVEAEAAEFVARVLEDGLGRIL
mmetsp:Transcript_19893/g.59001  ORF Transcript_19893/g.59001 Transcript_19893/m.59001 type:complete len:324 (+) Transcript_19893:100-1071(+)